MEHRHGELTSDSFSDRHIGPSAAEVAHMLAAVGLEELEEIDAALPAEIRGVDLDLPVPATEVEVLAELAELAARNKPMVQMIGQGYYDCHTPGVIRRNVLENPAWYTAYTPYQPEISQGRLEALLNFQTMVADLTGLPLANASLLDEPTAAAEAMMLLRRGSKAASPRFAVHADTHPQTIAVLQTRATPLGIELVLFDGGSEEVLPDDVFGALVSYPGSSGSLAGAQIIESAVAAGIPTAVTTDLLACTLLTPPGELGASVVVGSAQRLGVPMGFGGPHAGFMSVQPGLARTLPGRLVGVSKDADGRTAYRLALQTREQHIRREKATSNICTAQVLLAVISAMYATYHGPDGLTRIARRVHLHAGRIASAAEAAGLELVADTFFDTVQVRIPGRAADVVAAAAAKDINLRLVDSHTVGISCDETTTDAHVATVIACLSGSDAEPDQAASQPRLGRERTTGFLTHPVFTEHRSETHLLRYLRHLSDLDIALDRSMIPLGSCTMKLNATTEMEAITWPEWSGVHPFAPAEQTEGYRLLIGQLEGWLAEVTGYDAVSIQPNAGSQGEFAGLLAIRGWQESRGQGHRDVCLIPSSAHGTNAASAVMAGMKVVVVRCDEQGNVDMAHLVDELDKHAEDLAALMITYPSTHGVYEDTVAEICSRVHEAGGQVYVDGANLNALVGLAKPGLFGADVSHLNLHKTFCIPHGGGGPGVGPVAVREHLAPFLPSRSLGEGDAVGPVSGAPFGSAGILPIPWAYIRLMGADGLRRATRVAVLSANYIAARLKDSFPILYTGADGRVAHECILDLREITKRSGITVDDVAKRLIDYGFHAPTMSFPVAGTLMVEPTESESLDELDRFCEAMIAIRAEIDQVEAGVWTAEQSPLRLAPHTAEALVGEWDRPYSRQQAVYPVASLRRGKYWPPVSRIDGAYGDRNLVCSCPSPEAFAADSGVSDV